MIDYGHADPPVSPVMSVGFCSSLIVAVAESVMRMLSMKKKLYGAVSFTLMGSPIVASSGFGFAG
jgi:hypothetical protein